MENPTNMGPATVEERDGIAVPIVDADSFERTAEAARAPYQPGGAWADLPDAAHRLEQVERDIEIQRLRANLPAPKPRSPEEQARIDHSLAFNSPVLPATEAVIAQRIEAAKSMTPEARALAADRLERELDHQHGFGEYRRLYEAAKRGNDRETVALVAGDVHALRLLAATSKYAAAKIATAPGASAAPALPQPPDHLSPEQRHALYMAQNDPATIRRNQEIEYNLRRR